MINYTSSSWFPLYKFRVGEGLCDSDYMLGTTNFKDCKDYLTGKRIKQFSTVIWSRKFKVVMKLDNYLKFKNNKNYLQKLIDIRLTCDLKM